MLEIVSVIVSSYSILLYFSGLTKEAEAEVKGKPSVAVDGLLEDLKELTISQTKVETNEMNGHGAKENEVEEGKIVDDVNNDNAFSKDKQKDEQEVVEEVTNVTAGEVKEETAEEISEEAAEEISEEAAEKTSEEAAEKLLGKMSENETQEKINIEAATEDPSKWNLLELPKPVDPNNLPAPGDKKHSMPNCRSSVFWFPLLLIQFLSS